MREMLTAETPYPRDLPRDRLHEATGSRYAAQMGLGKSKRNHDWSAIRAFYEVVSQEGCKSEGS